MSDDAPVRFDADAGTVVTFLAALTGYAVVVNAFEGSLFNTSLLRAAAVAGIWAVAVVLTVAWVLRREGASLALLLPSRRETAAALVAFAGVWLAASAAQVVAGAVLDAPVRAGTAVDRPLLAVGLLVAEFVFTGLPEELAFRGYLQSRLVDAAPPGVVTHGGAVLLATTLFALWHVPDRALGVGFGPVETAASVVWVLLDGLLVFAVAYELTRNVVFAALVHAFLNEGVLLVAVASPARPGGVWMDLTVVAATAAAALAYRRWVTRTTGRPPDRTGPGAYRPAARRERPE